MGQLNCAFAASNQAKMKSVILAFIAIACWPVLAAGQAPAAVSADTGPPSEAVPSDQQNAQKARAIIERGIQALGGQAYLDIRDVEQEGRAYSFHHGTPNSLGMLFWHFRKYPDQDRYELTKKRDVIELYVGDKGYEVTFRGVRNLDSKELEPILRRRRFALDIILRQWLNEPGIALFYEGQTVAAQKQADQVTIMNSKNEAVTLYFDSLSHLPVKKTFAWRDPTDKQRNVEEEVFDNYRPVQNIMTPFDTTRFYNGDMAAQAFLNSVTYNQGIAAYLFDPQVAANKRR